jgi:hypothetical protein
MHIQDSLTDLARAAALLAEWDAMMAEVYEYVTKDRARRPEQIVFRFVRDEQMEGEMVKA